MGVGLWVFGLCPKSGVIKLYKVSRTGSALVIMGLEGRRETTLWGPLE